MKNSKLNILKLFIALLAPVCLINCGKNPTSPTSEGGSKSETFGTVRSTVLLGKVGVLHKGSSISLQKLILTAVSGATTADTVRDTSTVSGSDAVTVTRSLTLKPLRQWVIHARTMDSKDSIIHAGATSSFFVKPSDTVGVSLNLTSRFAMYQANFNSLPDSISSSAPGTGTDKLNLNRVVLKIDGQVKDDSVVVAGFFNGGQNVSVFFDYITPGSHTITLEAYGILHTYAGILYSGSSTFSVAAGVDDTKTITLGWVGPSTGTGKLTIVIGKVGKVIVNGGLSGAIL